MEPVNKDCWSNVITLKEVEDIFEDQKAKHRVLIHQIKTINALATAMALTICLIPIVLIFFYINDTGLNYFLPILCSLIACVAICVIKTIYKSMVNKLTNTFLIKE